MVLGRIGANDNNDVRVLACGERRRHRACTDALEKGRYRRRVAQPGAVINVVCLKPGANQFLE